MVNPSSRRIVLTAVLLALIAGVSPIARADEAGGDADRPKLHELQPFQVYLLGKTEPAEWQRLSDGQQKANVAGLKAFAERAIARGPRKLELTESPHFLFYSDLSTQEAKVDLIGLENAYARFSKFLDANRPLKPKDKGQGPDVWRGKMVLFIFAGSPYTDAMKFVPVVHPGEGEKIPALTLNGNGSVDLVSVQPEHGLFAQRDQAKLMAISFLYRLRKPGLPEPWLLIGLAQSFGDSLPYPAVATPGDPPPAPEKAPSAKIIREDLNAVDDLGDSLDHSDKEKKPKVYVDLVSFMIAHNSRRFVAFVNGVKDGKPWEKSLEDNYGTTLKELVSDYQDWVGRLRG